MRNLLLSLLFWLLNWGGNAWAQKGENLYAAPGMPILLSRRLPPSAALAARPWLTQPLSRFWRISDSLAQRQGMWQLTRAVVQRIQYPKLALANGLGEIIQIRMIVAPDGTPLTVLVIKSTLTLDIPDKKAGEALQAEAIRVSRLLRFQPKPGPIDTVNFPVTYRFE